MNTTILTQTTMFDATLDTAADRAWFTAHPGAHARCRLPRDGELEMAENDGDGARPVRLMIVTASGAKRPVREGPIPAGARWLRFGPDGEVLSQ